MPRTKSKLESIPTIDVSLVEILLGTEDDGMVYAIDTSTSVAVEPQTETQDAIRLVKLGRLIAQKMAKTTITGHIITLTDNVLSPTLLQILQGGTVTGSGDTLKYEPPVAGSNDSGKVFDLRCYSAQYDESGQIVNYERITYPNCQGNPVAISTSDNTFRVPEYTINSAPRKGQASYTIDYVTELPDYSEVETVAEVPEGRGIESNNFMYIGTNE